MLYARNAKVYVAARNEEKAKQAIDSMKSNAPKSSGLLQYLSLDLADLSTIKASAQEFLSKEKKLHVLFNNAGVMNPAPGSKTAQGYELQLGTNNIGTFMFTKLLTPILVSSAKVELPNTVRVVWVSSSAAEGLSPKGGVPMDNLDYHQKKGTMHQYAVSKAGNYLHGTEFARRYKDDGVVSLPLNPGNLDSELWRTQGAVMSFILKSFVLHPRILGAYTQLFAGLSPTVTIDQSGEWGKFHPKPY
jgi:retinol dehydrogenase-12